MHWKRGVFLAILTLCLIPGYGLCNGIVQFSLGNFSLMDPVATISSITGYGGSNSGTSLEVTGGNIDLTGIGNWLSGGTLDITASGTANGTKGEVASNTLLAGSFTGVNLFSGALTGFSGTLNTDLAGFYGLGYTLNEATVSVNWSAGSAVLSVDPGGAVAATEAGGLPITLGLVLMGGLLLLVGAHSKVIRVVI